MDGEHSEETWSSSLLETWDGTQLDGTTVWGSDTPACVMRRQSAASSDAVSDAFSEPDCRLTTNERIPSNEQEPIEVPEVPIRRVTYDSLRGSFFSAQFCRNYIRGTNFGDEDAASASLVLKAADKIHSSKMHGTSGVQLINVPFSYFSTRL